MLYGTAAACHLLTHNTVRGRMQEILIIGGLVLRVLGLLPVIVRRRTPSRSSFQHRGRRVPPQHRTGAGRCIGPGEDSNDGR